MQQRASICRAPVHDPSVLGDLAFVTSTQTIRKHFHPQGTLDA